MKIALLTLALFSFQLFAQTKATTKEFTYEVDGRKFQGFIASGASNGKKAPGVAVIHEWWGQNEYPRERAKKLAEEGFVAFAVDLFGEGKTASHPKKAQEFAQKAMGNLDNTKKNIEKALEILKKRDDTNEKMAIIGYCFGGGVALQMARLGVDVDLVASFHGSLSADFDMPQRKENPRILVFNGEDDPMVTKEQIKTFNQAMKKADVNYTFANYPDVKHAFTNPKADAYGKKFDLPLKYDEKAAKDSWQKTIYELKNL